MSLRDQAAGFEVIALPIHNGTSAAVKIMQTMKTLSAFVAIVVYHRSIDFVTPKVNLYKRRAVRAALSTTSVAHSMDYLNAQERVEFFSFCSIFNTCHHHYVLIQKSAMIPKL